MDYNTVFLKDGMNMYTWFLISTCEHSSFLIIIEYKYGCICSMQYSLHFCEENIFEYFHMTYVKK